MFHGDRGQIKSIRVFKKELESMKKLKLDYQNFRANFLIFWATLNMALARSIQIKLNETYASIFAILALIRLFFYASQLCFTILFWFKD